MLLIYAQRYGRCHDISLKACYVLYDPTLQAIPQAVSTGCLLGVGRVVVERTFLSTKVKNF